MRQFIARYVTMKALLKDVFATNVILKYADSTSISKYLTDGDVTVKDFQSGDIIYPLPCKSICVGIMLSGTATVEPLSANDKALLKLIMANDMFGVANLYCDDQPFPSVITAKSAARVLFINGTSFRSLIENDSGALKAYLRLMSDKIVFLNKKISTLTAGSTEKKLAVFLAEHERDGAFPQSLSMSALADILNIGRASLYRALDSLEAEGLIIRDGKKIMITDKNALLGFI